MRTIVWFIYFWLYLLIKLPLLRRGLKALDAGDWASQQSKTITKGFYNIRVKNK